MKVICPLLFVVFMLLCSALSPVLAQDTGGGDAPQSAVKIKDLPGYVNQYVAVEGKAGQKDEGSTANTKAYTFDDDYGGYVLVRTKQDFPTIGARYRVEGIVMYTGKAYIIIEDKRTALNGQPSDANKTNTENNKDTADDKSDKLFGLPKMTVYGIGLVIAALLIGLTILLIMTNKSNENKMALEQQRLAMERERERIQRAPAPAMLPTGSSTVMADSMPGSSAPKKPVHTVEAWGQLRVTSGPHTGMIAPLTGRQVTIGRDEGDMQLPNDSMVSTQHAEVLATNDGRMLFVDKSRNGSTVDGKPVHRTQVELKVDSIIEVGSSRIEIKAMRPPSINAAPQNIPPAPVAARTMIADMPFVPSTAAATGIFSGVEFVVISGADANKHYPIGKDSVTIGRREDQDVVLTDGFVSREHAVLRRSGKDWLIRNLSDKGTTINGESGTETILKNGDKIALGSTVMEFRVVGEAAQRAASTICE